MCLISRGCIGARLIADLAAPYARSVELPSRELELFGEGTMWRLRDLLGAHVTPDGVRFAVWAPNARRVRVVGDWNQASGGDSLQSTGRSGVWAGTSNDAQPGQRYQFAITSAAGEEVLKADPMARQAELAPSNASLIVGESAHQRHRGVSVQVDQSGNQHVMVEPDMVEFRPIPLGHPANVDIGHESADARGCCFDLHAPSFPAHAPQPSSGPLSRIIDRSEPENNTCRDPSCGERAGQFNSFRHPG